jgi:hypothetical protein
LVIWERKYLRNYLIICPIAAGSRSHRIHLMWERLPAAINLNSRKGRLLKINETCGDRHRMVSQGQSGHGIGVQMRIWK